MFALIYSLKITLPNGAQVKYKIGQSWLYEIHITPSIFDEGNVEGLCGNPNSDTSDDFILQGTRVSTLNSRDFQASWRYSLYCAFYFISNEKTSHTTSHVLSKKK